MVVNRLEVLGFDSPGRDPAICAQAQGLLGARGCVHIVESADVTFFRLPVVKLGVGDLAPDVLAVATAQANGRFARADTQGKARQTGVKGLDNNNLLCERAGAYRSSQAYR